MQNKPDSKLYLLFPFLVALAVAIFLFWLFNRTLKVDIKDKSSDNTIELNTKVYKKLTEPDSVNMTVSPDTEKFGRDNPFANYK